MKIFSWLSCILVAVVAVVAEEREPPTELQIETTFKPESCPHKAKTRDHVHVHYVSCWGDRKGLYWLDFNWENFCRPEVFSRMETNSILGMCGIYIHYYFHC